MRRGRHSENINIISNWCKQVLVNNKGSERKTILISWMNKFIIMGPVWFFVSLKERLMKSKGGRAFKEAITISRDIHGPRPTASIYDVQFIFCFRGSSVS